MNKISQEKIDEIVVKKYKNDKEDIIQILQDISALYNYLPEEALRMVANSMKIPISHVFSVATFYKAFSLEPRGRHQVDICLGTACHVRGGNRILEKLERDLHIRSGETDYDFRFTLETVRCIGCCSLGPVIKVDEDTYGRVKLEDIPKIIEKYT